MKNGRTFLSKKTLKALTAYHLTKQPVSRKKKLTTLLLGIFLIIISTLNAYGYWMKYYGNESVIVILLKSSVLFLLSITILYTNIHGPKRRLYMELKHYFDQIGISYIDYVISIKGIEMIMNHHSEIFEWEMIDYIESDTKFYYFTCDGKHSIISKSTVSDTDIELLNSFILRCS